MHARRPRERIRRHFLRERVDRGVPRAFVHLLCATSDRSERLTQPPNWQQYQMALLPILFRGAVRTESRTSPTRAVDQRVLEGGVVSHAALNEIGQDFSLGYTVGLKFSESAQTFAPFEKRFNEVSIVRGGARESCRIHGFSCDAAPQKRKRSDLMDNF